MGKNKFYTSWKQHKAEKWSRAPEKPTDLRKWNAVKKKKVEIHSLEVRSDFYYIV